jgi:hypothetical protein
LFVCRKVTIQRKCVAERNDGDKISRLHLVVDVIAGGLLRPFEVLGLHRRVIEEEYDEAAVV